MKRQEKIINKCSACRGAYHPATGHAWSASLVLCLRCAKDFIHWIKVHERAYNRPWRKPASKKISFIEAAITISAIKKRDLLSFSFSSRLLFFF
jgi:hypothetical protein